MIKLFLLPFFLLLSLLFSSLLSFELQAQETTSCRALISQILNSASEAPTTEGRTASLSPETRTRTLSLEARTASLNSPTTSPPYFGHPAPTRFNDAYEFAEFFRPNYLHYLEKKFPGQNLDVEITYLQSGSYGQVFLVSPKINGELVLEQSFVAKYFRSLSRSEQRMDAVAELHRELRSFQIAEEAGLRKVIKRKDLEMTNTLHFEWARYGDLESFIKNEFNGDIQAELFPLFRDMALILEEVYERGLFYFDFKPANILIKHSTFPHNRPEAVLGDLASLIRRNEIDYRNFNYQITPVTTAPEIYQFYLKRVGNPQNLAATLERSLSYSLAVSILRSLFELPLRPVNALRHLRLAPTEDVISAIKKSPNYEIMPEELLEILLRSLDENPLNRPSLREIRRAIEQSMNQSFLSHRPHLLHLYLAA